MINSQRLYILNNQDFSSTYDRPRFNDLERRHFFVLSEPELQIVKLKPFNGRETASKLYFILQLGYFKAKHLFFKFQYIEVEDDVRFVLQVLSQKINSRGRLCLFARERSEMLSFKWRHFKQDIILMLVRWYLAYSLSYRDVEELALERGLKVDHSTINRWVIDYSPQLEEVFRKRHKRPVGISWRMDETYIKVKGQWVYLYRAVDKEGKTVDFMLSEKRDEPAARAFFEKAIGCNGLPDKVTMDKSGANKAGIDTINLQLALLFMLGGLFVQLTVRQIKYLNNIVEQDHRFIKKITKPMKGFKAFHSADATLAGIELHHMLRKNQHTESANQTIFEQFYGLAV